MTRTWASSFRTSHGAVALAPLPRDCSTPPLRNTYPGQGAREKADRLAAIFPGAACPVAHWGYVYSGKARVEYVNQPEEIFNAGDFFVPPGHRPYMLEDTELLRITERMSSERS